MIPGRSLLNPVGAAEDLEKANKKAFEMCPVTYEWDLGISGSCSCQYLCSYLQWIGVNPLTVWSRQIHCPQHMSQTLLRPHSGSFPFRVLAIL